MRRRLGRDEAAEYYFRYIDQVPEGDLLATLAAQGRDMVTALRAVSEAASLARPAPDAWSVREVVNHLSDTERLFQARAFWFARGFSTALPSFDQLVAAAAARADERDWPGLVAEFATVRAASLSFFASLPYEAWDRRGIASDHPFSVRALAYLTAGHAAHHLQLLRSRGLVG